MVDSHRGLVSSVACFVAETVTSLAGVSHSRHEGKILLTGGGAEGLVDQVSSFSFIKFCRWACFTSFGLGLGGLAGVVFKSSRDGERFVRCSSMM